MKNKTSSLVESSYRTYNGKLFAALFKEFGAKYLSEIEDAIQNSFYKSLKAWKPALLPKHKENWLYIVARNDVINQIIKKKNPQLALPTERSAETNDIHEDLRLKTILFLSRSKDVSTKAKVLFILKNIFGLHIREISECTLLSQHAIYKSIKRAKEEFQRGAGGAVFDSAYERVTEIEITIVEEILYGVFNIGFDSFSKKDKLTINEDLCLEALALAKLLSRSFERATTKNLLALFCFHLARIPAKIKEGRLISFFEQDRAKWDNDFIKLGFYYLEKPGKLSKYYVEALIVSKHMMTASTDTTYWNEVVKLYQLLLTLSNSPIMRLNLCYCLSKAQRVDDTKRMIDALEIELSNDHIYFSLVKFSILKNIGSEESDSLFQQVLQKIEQKIRRQYLLENMAMDM